MELEASVEKPNKQETTHMNLGLASQPLICISVQKLTIGLRSWKPSKSWRASRYTHVATQTRSAVKTT